MGRHQAGKVRDSRTLKNPLYSAQTIEPGLQAAEDTFVQNVNSLSLLIGIGLVILTAVARILECMRTDRIFAPRNPGEAATLSLATLFHHRVSDFQSHVRTLDEHSHEYTAVFSANEWSSLTESLERLSLLDAEVQHHIHANNYPHAQKILGNLYVNTSSEQIARDIASVASGEWEESIRAMLKRVVSNLEAATHETSNLHLATCTRKRQPTLVTLADVKKALIEDEVISRKALRE